MLNLEMKPDTPIGVKPFMAMHPESKVTLGAMRQRVIYCNLQPVKSHPTRSVAALYKYGDLLRALHHKRKPHDKLVSEDITEGWVQYPLNTKITVTNCAGVEITGLFAGYKGDIFGRLELETEETIFGWDSEVRLADENEPIAIRDHRVKMKGYNGVWVDPIEGRPKLEML